MVVPLQEAPEALQRPSNLDASMIRVFSHYISIRTMLLMMIEGVLLLAASLAGIAIRFSPAALNSGTLLTPEALLFTFFMIVVMAALGLYQTDASEAFVSILNRTIIAFAAGSALMSVVFYLFPEAYIGRGVFACTAAIAFASVLVVRLAFFRWTAFGILKKRVLILGAGEQARAVLELVSRDGREHSIEVVGVHPLTTADAVVTSARILPITMSVSEAAHQFGAHEIIIAMREQRGGALPVSQLLDCKLRGVQITDLQSFFERELGQIRLDSLKASWLVFGEGCRQGLLRETVKRLFDVLASSLLLICTLPVMIVTAIVIKLHDGGPIFYGQDRVGQGGRVFEILKFRSMRSDAERDGKPKWAKSNDDRITPIGRFIRRTRIDELPQIINVLRGEMSFVGPRPERPYFVRQLVQDIPFYAARHSVKPGITGWAQVRYPYGASLDDASQKLQYDLYYVKNHSLFLDLLILVETVEVVLWGKGAR
jgi:sugar transferase (PEP-CTERM system associated)